MQRDISDLRKSYTRSYLNEDNLPNKPLLLFDSWFNEIKSSNSKIEINEKKENQ